MALIQKVLQDYLAKTVFTAQDDEICSAKKYYSNGLDCLLTALAGAAMHDGLDQQTVMKLFQRQATDLSNG